MTARLSPEDLSFVPVDQAEGVACQAFEVVRQSPMYNDAYDRLERWLTEGVGLGAHKSLRIRTTVALLGGEIVGYIATHAHEIHPDRLDRARFERPFSALKVLHLATNRPYQGRGVGEILLLAFGIGSAALLTRTTGCRFVFLDALKPAVGFYERLAFEIVPTGKPNAIWAPMIFDLKKAGSATLDSYREIAGQLLTT